MGSARKELKEIVKAAEAQGWRVKRTRKGHLVFFAPDGVNMAVAAGTPGGGRAMDNFLAELRGYGFVWKGR
jgi:ABC-type phosphonate transport system ATPase subunit